MPSEAAAQIFHAIISATDPKATLNTKCGNVQASACLAWFSGNRPDRNVFKDLQKSALIAEVIGGIGIVISILYLAFEISQNTSNLKAANAMAVSTDMNTRRFARVTDPELNALILKGQTQPDLLSEEERSRFTLFVFVRFTLLENLLYMDDQDLLPPGFADSLLPGYCASLKRPGYQLTWDSLDDSFSDRLRIFLDDCYSQ